MLCHDRLDRHRIELLSFARHVSRRFHLVPSYTENCKIAKLQNIKRNPWNRKKWFHSLTVIVSTVRVLLLTVCDDIISPSAEYPGLFSPRITWCCSLADDGPAPTIVDTVDATVAFGSLPSSWNQSEAINRNLDWWSVYLRTVGSKEIGLALVAKKLAQSNATPIDDIFLQKPSTTSMRIKESWNGVEWMDGHFNKPQPGHPLAMNCMGRRSAYQNLLNWSTIYCLFA